MMGVLNNPKIRPYLRRLLIILLFSILASWAISELSFAFMQGNLDRAPQTVELIIPPGTAELVAQGQPVPAIPGSMVFVLGDVLVVENQDSVGHELGPLLIPPGTRASMPMDEADHYAISCSFQPSNYLGLTVREPTNLSTRLLAVVFAAPPTAVIAFLYSLVIRPIRTDEEPAGEASA